MPSAHGRQQKARGVDERVRGVRAHSLSRHRDREGAISLVNTVNTVDDAPAVNHFGTYHC